MENMKKKNISLIFYRIILVTVLSISFLIVFYINYKTHPYHDEFVYSCIYGTTQRITNLRDLFTSVYNLYFMHNGRAITHFILMAFLMQGKLLRDIVNSLFFVILLYQLIRYATKGEKNNILKSVLALLIFPLLWNTIPAFGETVIWFAGSVNYLWTTVFLLFYLKLVNEIFKQEKNFSKTKLIIFYLLSFIIPSLHESVGIISCSYLGLVFLYLWIKNKKINTTLLKACLFSAVGFLCVVLSPGTEIRKLAELQTMENVPTLLENLTHVFRMLLNTIKSCPLIFILIFFGIIFSFYVLLKHKKGEIKKEAFEFLFLCISAFLAYLAMVVSPTFLERVTFVPYIIFTLAGFKALQYLRNFPKIQWIQIAALFVLFILSSIKAYPTLLETKQLVSLQNMAWEKRDEEINQQIQEGKQDIIVEPLNVTLNKYMYGGELSTSISFNHNGSMAAAYGVNSIRLRSNYYLDLGLTNLNSQNTKSIQLSSNNYQENSKFYLLDKEVYDKMAPYKKYKNSYASGDITLYYAMPNIEQLKITFLEEQEISISKIKLYTPEEILEDLSPQEMLDVIKLENIDVIDITNDFIKLKAQANSSLYFAFESEENK